MNISNLKFITDENIDVEVKDYLRQEGFDVFDIKEELLFSMPDDAILAFSYKENRVIITQDSDFGTLIFRDNNPFCGIIYLRPGHVSPFLHIETFKTLMKANLEVNLPFLIVAENNEMTVKIRIRQL